MVKSNEGHNVRSYGEFTLDVKWVLNENLGGILGDM
jgi:hypothetical protein